MKRLCFMILAVLMIGGCDFLGMKEDKLTLAPDQMRDVPLSENGEGFEIIFTSLDEWRAEIEYFGYASGWASINRTNGEGDDLPQKLRVGIQKNSTKEIRYAKVVITSGRSSVEVTFNQNASDGMNDGKPDTEQKPDDEKEDGPVFRLTDNAAELSAEAGTFSVTVEYNVDYECKYDADWITEVTVKSVNQMTHVFEVAANTSTESRSAVISFCGNNTCLPFTVTQAGAFGDEGDDGGDEPAWANSSFYHRSVAMRFTADWCGWCPVMATALKNAQEILGNKLEVLNVHASGTYYSQPSEKLASFYSITGFPTGYVDGWILVVNDEIPYVTTSFVNAVQMTEATYPVVTGVSWESSLSGAYASLDVSVYVKEPGTYKVTALAVEDDIIGYQADVFSDGIEDFEHDAVVRAAFSDPLGDLFDVEDANQVITFSYSLEVPSEYVADNMRTVIYVQRLDVPAGRYYVDNVAAAKLGENKELDVYSDNLGGGNEGIVPGDDINVR